MNLGIFSFHLVLVIALSSDFGLLLTTVLLTIYSSIYLSFDLIDIQSRGEKQIGGDVLHEHIQGHIIQHYLQYVPQALLSIHKQQEFATQRLTSIQSQLKKLNGHQLRIVSTQFVSDFIESIEGLLNGSFTDVDKHLYGQTLADEIKGISFIQSNITKIYVYINLLLSIVIVILLP